ncbi:conserved hypothetical protein [Trichophyton verrucosum HKI 0517]|uniref:Cenp-O kinetochore centromere component n=1 Tax=Trichophyton verrucosum (strain HKI 0517) TaxID=663202 RepID=D4CZH5_TRIVH|nr:uncharacterized protein TRV_00217 [Trichophyton verrucosum HKI 0517]EFE44966.1 conserved hypothetical protein [Trichophyton verrucosum HKI 0517]
MAEENQSAALDEEISAVREESRSILGFIRPVGPANSDLVQKLTARRQVLSASLLSSSTVRNSLESHLLSQVDSDTPSAIVESKRHAETNHHRIVFSATSFPFKDPSPHTDSPDLLGFRIDVNVRDGTFVKPYYLLLRRTGGDRKLLQIHRHTIPVFIPLKHLEQKYLPIQASEDGSGGGLKPWKRKKQNLKGLVRGLRRELVAWHLRRDVITLLQEQLGIANLNSTDIPANTTAFKLGILSVTAASIEARYIRFQWQDGRIGRVKVCNRGLVERVIIIGDNGRDKVTEMTIAGGDTRAESIVQRLLDSET